MKAAHRGHCQVCNRIQKLPSGKLAKHGYQVLSGYFEGTCFGSGELPLELDKKIVVKSIEWAKVQQAKFEESIVTWSRPATEPEAWFNEYVESISRYLPSQYVWRRVPLLQEKVTPRPDYTYTENFFTNHKGQKVPLRRHSIYGDDLLKIANELNAKYVEQFLKKAVRDMRQYASDQKHRIEVWHKQPLLPLE